MNLRKFYLVRAIGFIVVILLALIYFAFFKDKVTAPGQNQNTNQEQVFCTMEAKLCPDGSYVGRSGPKCEFAPCPELKSALTEKEARVIAEATCIKGGESLSPGTYNAGTKTWWFDANLNATREGCNPACVVSESTKTAEINWRCTGLIVPTDPAEDIKKLFVLKYPDYIGTIDVQIKQQTENHARGSVSFVSDQAGGIFLATKIDGAWQLVFDGNGAIPCSLNKYAFPSEMLTDCAP